MHPCSRIWVEDEGRRREQRVQPEANLQFCELKPPEEEEELFLVFPIPAAAEEEEWEEDFRDEEELVELLMDHFLVYYCVLEIEVFFRILSFYFK